MCGRFTLRTPPPLLAEVFAVEARPNLAARYNIAPSQDILVVRAIGETGAREFAPSAFSLLVGTCEPRRSSTSAPARTLAGEGIDRS